MIRLGHDESFDLASDEFKRLATSSIPVIVSGWGFRSNSLLEKHADAIREHFEILPTHRKRVSSLIQSLRDRSDHVVGVHVRHGDYANFENYAAAMRSIQQQLAGKRVTFLVCGNAKLNQADFGRLDVQFGTGHLIEDMYALAESDLLIGPPSTFTGWAAFYGQTALQFLDSADQEIDVRAMLKQTSKRIAA